MNANDDLVYLGIDDAGIEYYIFDSFSPFSKDGFKKLFSFQVCLKRGDNRIISVFHQIPPAGVKQKNEKAMLQQVFQEMAPELSHFLDGDKLDIILKDQGVLINPSAMPAYFVKFYKQHLENYAVQGTIGKKKSGGRGRGRSKSKSKSSSRSRSGSRSKGKKRSSRSSSRSSSGSSRSRSRSRSGSRSKSKGKSSSSRSRRSKTSKSPSRRRSSGKASSSSSSSSSRRRSRSGSRSSSSARRRSRSGSKSPSRNSRPSKNPNKRKFNGNLSMKQNPENKKTQVFKKSSKNGQKKQIKLKPGQKTKPSSKTGQYVKRDKNGNYQVRRRTDDGRKIVTSPSKKQPTVYKERYVKKTVIRNEPRVVVNERYPLYRSGYHRYDTPRAFIDYFYSNPTYYPVVRTFLPVPVTYDPVTRRMIANRENEEFMERLYQARPDFGIEEWTPVFQHYSQQTNGIALLQSMSILALRQASVDITNLPYVPDASMQSKLSDTVESIRAVLPTVFPFPQPLTSSFNSYFVRMKGYKVLFERYKKGLTKEKTLKRAKVYLGDLLILINSRMISIFDASEREKVNSFMSKLYQYTQSYLTDPTSRRELVEFEYQVKSALGPFGSNLVSLWNKPHFGYLLERTSFPQEEQSMMSDDVAIGCVLADSAEAFNDDGDYIEYYLTIMGKPFTFKIHRAGGLSLYSNNNNMPSGFTASYETTKIVPRCHLGVLFQMAAVSNASTRKAPNTEKFSDSTALIILDNEKFVLKKKSNPQFFTKLDQILNNEMNKK